MHELQPIHTKMKIDEIERLTKEFNISIAQLPKISIKDPTMPEGCEISDVIKIERTKEGKKSVYYRVVAL
jgi:DNA-directed RNA polymerase subunit H (RpoH/RPB5)